MSLSETPQRAGSLLFTANFGKYMKGLREEFDGFVELASRLMHLSETPQSADSPSFVTNVVSYLKCFGVELDGLILLFVEPMDIGKADQDLGHPFAVLVCCAQFQCLAEAVECVEIVSLICLGLSNFAEKLCLTIWGLFGTMLWE